MENQKYRTTTFILSILFLALNVSNYFKHQPDSVARKLDIAAIILFSIIVFIRIVSFIKQRKS